MARTKSFKAKFVSAKTNKYRKISYTFEITPELYQELEETRAKIHKALGLREEIPIYSSWFGYTTPQDGDDMTDILSSRPLLRFTKVECEDSKLAELEVGKMYNVVAGIKHYNINGKHGISTSLCGVMEV